MKNDIVDVYIGQELKDARISKGLSQTELSNAVGLRSAAAISRYEDGLRSISLTMLIRICRVLGVEHADIINNAAKRIK